MKIKHSLFVIFRVLLIAVLVIMAAFPFYWMAATALSTDKQLYTAKGQPWYLQLENIGTVASALTKIPVARWLTNTLFISIGTTILSLLLGTLGGYALSRFRFRGKGVVTLALFVTQVLPEALILIPIYALFITLGLLDSRWGLVLANVGFSMPVSTFIIKNAVDAIPYELEESAQIDDCPRISIITMIVFPLIAPSMAAAAVMAFFAGWNEYLFASTFIDDTHLWPLSVGLASFIGQYDTPLGTVMGAAFLFSIPAIIFFILIQRKIVSGLTAGAVKG